MSRPVSPRTPPGGDRAVAMVLAGGTLLLAGLWAAVVTAGPALVRAMASGDAPGVLTVPPWLLATATPAGLAAMLTRALALVSGVWALVLAAWLARRRLARALAAGGFAGAWLSGSILLGASAATFLALRSQGFEGSWYRLADVMAFTAGPPYQHRVLFVWLADGLHALFPGWAPSRCYFVSQIPVVVAAFAVIRPWSALFVPRGIARLSPLVLAAMLIPTFGYYTFYDVGVVLFSTACLLLLFRRRYLAYLAVFLVGVLNHEVILLLVPVFALVAADAMPRRRLLGWIALQLAGYAVVRLALFHFLPAPAAWSPGKLWMNIDFLAHRPGPVAVSAAAVGFWWAAAAAGLPHAPRRLLRCLILAPLLLAMILVVGQVNEPRLMNSFVPVVAALILIAVARVPGMRADGAGTGAGPADA